MAGFKRKLYTVTWPEGHELHGLEVTTKGLSIGKLAGLIRASQEIGRAQDTDAKIAAGDRLLEGFASRLVSWNLEEDDGTPVPATAEGVADQDMQLMMELITGWMDAVASVDTPLPQPSPNGATTATAPSLEASLPMVPSLPSPSS
jgi:hypothetical protein